MTLQALSTSISLSNFFFTLPVSPISEPSSGFSARELGVDIDEEELGAELMAQTPGCMNAESLLEVAPEEFDARFCWFLA